MNTLEHLAAEYLLNSLWQTPLLFAVAWVLARMLRRLGPSVEHRVWVGALLAQCILPVCSAPVVATALRQLFTDRSGSEGLITVTFGPLKQSGQGATGSVLHTFTLLYLAITALFLARFVWHSMQPYRLLRTAVPVRLDAAGALFVQRTCEQYNIRHLSVVAASGAYTPLTFGLLRPALVLPLQFERQTPTAEFQAALGHELAHIRRHDAAKHVLYRFVSLPMHYHPALWLTQSFLAETRERICDEMAAAQTGGARQYARALLALASLLSARRPAQSHAIGLFDANQLERRILMLNQRSRPLAQSIRVALLAGSAVLATATCTAAAAFHLNTQASAQSENGKQPAHISGAYAAGLVVSRVTPVYPTEAKQAKVQGAVVLHAIISKTGTVERLTVVSGPDVLRAPALDAVRQWVYKPYILNGEPTDVDTTITVNFSLTQ